MPCRGLTMLAVIAVMPPVIGRTAARKTWAAVWLLLNDAAPRRDGSCSLRIGGTKHGDDGQADSRGHRASRPNRCDEEMTLREQRGKSAIAVFPVRSMGGRRISAEMAVETLASAAVPKRMTSASASDCN